MSDWRKDFFKPRVNERESNHYQDFADTRDRVRLYLHRPVKILLDEMVRDGKLDNKIHHRERYKFPREPQTLVETVEKLILLGAQQEGYALTEEQLALLNRFIYE